MRGRIASSGPGHGWRLSLPRPRRLAGALALSLAAAAALGAAPDAPSTALDRYLEGMTSLRTAFTQSVTDARGSAVENGAGTLLVVRPGKFRWDYQPRVAAAVSSGNADSTGASADHTAAQRGDSGQLLVADGKNLWFYDRELAQVSVKPMTAALSATPIMLLSGSIAQLHDSFDISPAGSHDGLDWVSVKPRSAEADFSHAELGFARDRLARMVVNDRLGQTVQLDFARSERNARVDPKDLQFKPPDGVDVIGTPQS